MAVSDKHEDLYRELRKKSIDDVYVFYSPTEKEKKYKVTIKLAKSERSQGVQRQIKLPKKRYPRLSLLPFSSLK